MAEAKLAPSLPQWMVDHANRYISSGGKEGHVYTVTPPGYSEMHLPSLLLTTTGRKSGQKYIFPLFYGEDGKNYIIVASKGGAPQHPNWYQNLVANPEVEVQVGTKDSKRRPGQLPAPNANACGKSAEVLATLCGLRKEDRAPDPGGRYWSLPGRCQRRGGAN